MNFGSVKYVNIKGRLWNPKNQVQFYEDGSFFVAEHNGFAIPSDEVPETFNEHFDRYLKLRSMHGEINLAGIPIRQYEALKSNYKINWTEICWLYYYDGTGYEGLTSEYTFESKAYTLDVLRKSDISKVFEHYTYKDDGIGYIESIIENQPTQCARYKGLPVSWVVQREDGSLGIMYTLESHRRKGLGEWLSKHLIHQVIQKGEMPYLHIVVGNAASVALAERLGFKKYGKIVWFGVQNPYYKTGGVTD